MSDATLNKEATRAINYKQLKVTSSVFKENEMIPAKYTCDGVNVSIPLDIKHIPEEAKCLALIVDDPDAPICSTPRHAHAPRLAHATRRTVP